MASHLIAMETLVVNDSMLKHSLCPEFAGAVLASLAQVSQRPLPCCAGVATKQTLFTHLAQAHDAHANHSSEKAI